MLLCLLCLISCLYNSKICELRIFLKFDYNIYCLSDMIGENTKVYNWYNVYVVNSDM